MPSKKTISISVPCSTSNIGPGFDVLGLSLDLHLTLKATVNLTRPSSPSSPPAINITYTGQEPSTVPLIPSENLITSTALDILAKHGHSNFPFDMDLHIHNPIPLGRGLGSSGSAVVAGVCLANLVGSLNLNTQELLDYCVEIEGHPDNVAAAFIGGFVASFVVDEAVNKRVEDGVNGDKEVDGKKKTFSLRLPFNTQKVKTLVAIPDYHVATKKARAALPGSYSVHDVVYNLQRLTVLTHALTGNAYVTSTSLSCPETKDCSPINPAVISEAMKDKLHQPWRSGLLPGFPEIHSTITPDATPGLLGICVSGAGPTVLILATDNFDKIGEKVKSIFRNTKHPEGKEGGVNCDVMVLDVVEKGAEWNVVVE
ncbi:homoserine kinase [Paraphysoderma sedebokerense]|nr:homoserine kinase [Paraphysoderma sedebokerense]